MIISELKKNYLAKTVAAAFFAATTFCYSLLKINDINSFVKLIQLGLPEAKKDFFTLRFFESIPFLPVFIVWFFIGATLYFFYYSISLVYSDLSNRIIVKTSYANTTNEANEFNISRVKRIVLHITVILYYLFALGITFLFTVPVSTYIQNASEIIVQVYIAYPYSFIISLFISFLFWLIMLNAFTLFLDVIFSFIIKEEIKEEHFAIETT